MSWSDQSWQVIAEVHATLPKTATISERKKAMRAAYPFGERKHYPYKVWLKAQRKYLARYDTRCDISPAPFFGVEQ